MIFIRKWLFFSTVRKIAQHRDGPSRNYTSIFRNLDRCCERRSIIVNILLGHVIYKKVPCIGGVVACDVHLTSLPGVASPVLC